MDQVEKHKLTEFMKACELTILWLSDNEAIYDDGHNVTGRITANEDGTYTEVLEDIPRHYNNLDHLIEVWTDTLEFP